MSEEKKEIITINPAEIEILDTNFIVARVAELKKIKEEIMEKGIHYDLIPGCGDKPAILKPGSELLCMAFQLCPKYDLTITEPGGGHREYSYQGYVIHIPSGKIVSYGVGMCSTMELKYRWRESKRKCPTCNKETIYKSKFEKGWYCYTKVGGCGAKFNGGDQSIENQPVGRVENPDIADCYNTVMKIGKKRCQSDMVLTATAASSLFMPDPSEFTDDDKTPPPAKEKEKQKSNPPKSKSDGKAAPEQVKAIQTLLGKIYEGATDNVKHAASATMLGLEEIKSFRDLSFEKASTLISMLSDEANK